MLGLVLWASGCEAPAESPTDGAQPVDALQPDGASSDAGPTAPRFVEVAEEAGLVYEQHEWPIDECEPDWSVKRCIARLFTGGAAVGDYDGDGWPDVYATRLDGPDRLFRNRGDGTFEEVSLAAGIDRNAATNGAAFGDVDDDGDLDLLVTIFRGERNFLYINQGDGTFTEEAIEHGVDQGGEGVRSGMSACFGDYDLDGFVDLHVNHWWSAESDTSLTRLFHNRGDGTFEDVTVEAGVDLGPLDDSGTMAFTSRFVDMNEDGWPDLPIVADFGQTRFFWNQGDGTFVDGTSSLGDGVPSDENGMGLSVADFDGDGRLDWFVTSIYDDRFPCQCDGWGRTGNRMYRNLGGGTFEDATDAFGVREGGWGWGAVAFDYEQDGDWDLAMTNGYLLDSEWTQVFHDDPMRLWANLGSGPMEERAASEGLTDTGSGKALLRFDYDRDGDQDLLITTNGGRPLLYRNDGPVGNHLRVRARGRGAPDGTNRLGIGAKVEVRVRPGDPVRVWHLDGACGFLGQSENVAHFGLGDADSIAELRVTFPATGETVVRTEVQANQELIIREPE